jgi:hypothetical protein
VADPQDLDIVPGTLDLLILKSLAVEPRDAVRRCWANSIPRSRPRACTASKRCSRRRIGGSQGDSLRGATERSLDRVFVAVMLLANGVIAAFVPGWRAVRIEPATAIRND